MLLALGAVLLVAALAAVFLTQTGTPAALASLPASPTAPDGTSDPGTDLPRSAPELEALLPDEIGGTETVKFSLGGAEFMADQEGSGISPAFVAFLERVGAQPDDISIAVALSINADGGSAAIGAFRVQGASSDELEREFMATMETDGAVVEWQSASVGGKNVQTAPDPDTEGSTVYIYTAGDIVFFVTTPDEAVAAELLEPLP